MKRIDLLAVILGVSCSGCGGQRATTIALDPNGNVEVQATVAVSAPARPAFADDAEGKLLVAKLQPADVAVERQPRTPLPVKPPVSVEKPEPALPAQRAELKRGELASAAKPVRPYLLSTESPLTRELIESALPQHILMQVGPLVRVPSKDVERMQPLPYLSDKPAADPASGSDPTTAYSRELAVTTKAPARATPAPFQRIDLADPFRDRAVVQLKTTPVEVTTPTSPDAKKP